MHIFMYLAAHRAAAVESDAEVQPHAVVLLKCCFHCAAGLQSWRGSM